MHQLNQFLEAFLVAWKVCSHCLLFTVTQFEQFHQENDSSKVI